MSGPHDVPPRPQRAPGPGFPESLLWVAGYHAAQLLAAGVLLGLMMLAVFGEWPQDAALVSEVVAELATVNQGWLMTAILGSATLGALFFIVPAACWRLRPQPRKALGMNGLTFRQGVLLGGTVLPLGILSDELYRVALRVMGLVSAALGEQWPSLSFLLEETDLLSLVQQQSVATAYPILLVIVGLGPAIGEEIVFRGVIGRGLIARWGAFAGVLLTSMLFAMAHVSPAHAVATVPLAVFLHVAYLATGTIWAPIMVHFLNNALSVTMMKYGLGPGAPPSFVLLGSAAMFVAAVGLMLVLPLRPANERTSISDIRDAAWPIPEKTPGVAVFPAWLTCMACIGVLSFTCSFVLAA